MNEKMQEQLLDIFQKRFQDYNTRVLKELGETIKKFKFLTPSQASLLAQELKYDYSIKELEKELSNLSGLSIKEIKKILEKVAKDNIKFSDVYFKSRGLETPVYEENKGLQRLVDSVYKVAENDFKNIIKSTGFRLIGDNGKPLYLNIDETYKYVLDKCVIAVSQGKETFYQSMRKTMRELSNSGVRRIEYKTGYTRRLDSSIRQNLQDTIKQVSNESQKLFGETFGSDGVEVSAHLICADDHIPVQSKQFSNEEFEKLQSMGIAKDYTGKTIDIRLKGNFRPISTLNCGHYIFSIILGVSKPQYSEKELKEINEKNEKGFEFEGKHYSLYEGQELQRRIETNIRYAKDTQILAKASGDNDLVLKSQKRITDLTTKYKQLCKVSGLPNKLSSRANVAGYKRISKKRLEG